MKKTISTILCYSLILTLSAQAPQAFNYQAVARDLSGTPLTNQNIGLRFTILEGLESSVEVYQEMYLLETNNLGLFSVQIGKGSTVKGSMEEIAWGKNEYFLQVELDENGGSDYIIIGTSQLLSVPYALYSESGGEWENDNIGLNSKNRNIAIGEANSNPAYLINARQSESQFYVQTGEGAGIAADRSFEFENISAVIVGTNDNNAAAGYVFDAQNGDILGFDYGTLYQYDNGVVELNNRGDNPLVLATNNQARVIITRTGDLFLPTISNGIIMKSPNGQCWRYLPDNTGQLQASNVTCPE